jgi:hypothetical protein
VRVRNLSAGGLRLCFQQQPPIAPFLIVDVSHPQQNVSCSLRVRPLYKVEQPGGCHVVGASFPHKLDSMTLRALLS